MKLSESIKPISYFKTNAAEIIKNLADQNGTMIITQNGEAKAVVQDINTYEQIQESLAMLKMLAMSKNSVSEGKIKPADKVLKKLEQKIKQDFS